MIAAVFTILSIPLMVIGAMIAALAIAWTLLLPAVLAGFVVVMVSFVAAAC
jgi:hypothetical protein